MKRIIWICLIAIFVTTSHQVLAGTYTFQGTVEFPVAEYFSEIWDTNNDGYVGLPFADVSIYDGDFIGSNLLASGTTTADGFYDITFNYSGPATDPNPDVIIVITLDNSWGDVETWGGGVYSFKSDKMTNLAAGYYNIGFQLDDTENYSIAATVHAILAWAYDYYYNVEGMPFYHKIPSVFPGGIVNSYSILGANFLKKLNFSSQTPLNSYIVLHENGHALTYHFPNYSNEFGWYGGDGEHTWDSSEPTDTAFFEGLAGFLQTYLHDKLLTDPYRRFTGYTQVAGYGISNKEKIENHEYNIYAETNEGNVAAALWDLVDSENETQVVFADQTQDKPITDIVPWRGNTNIVEVYRVLDINTTNILLYAKSRTIGVYFTSRGNTMRTARAIPPRCTSSIFDSKWYLTANYIYEVCSADVYRHSLTTPYKAQHVLGSSGSPLVSYPTDVDTSHIQIGRDSDRLALYYWTYPESTSGFSPVLDKLDNINSSPTLSRIGSAAPECDDEVVIIADKQYCFVYGGGSFGDRFIEHDPVTGITTDLLPLNPLTEKDVLRTGNFSEVTGVVFSVVYSEMHAIGTRIYFLMNPAMARPHWIFEIDLTHKTLVRHAGDGTTGSTNAANLKSSIEDFSRIVLNGGSYYYIYVDNWENVLLPVTKLRRVELDPVNELITAYCGRDEIDLTLEQVLDTVDASRRDIKSHDAYLATLYGGNHADLLINNWINLTICDSFVETIVDDGTASSEMDETPPSTDTDMSNYNDGTDDRTMAPMTPVVTGAADSDGDGRADFVDVFPTDDSEWSDFDADGTGDNSDTDDDNDGADDTTDAFPYDNEEQVDTDGDGVGDNQDPA